MYFLTKPLNRLTQASVLLASLVLVVAVAPESAFAQQGNSHGNGNGNAHQHDQHDQHGNHHEKASVDVDYGKIRQLAVDNNMTGYQGLPPGIQRNLARGKALPPGIAKKQLPPQMHSALPVVAGHEWQVVGQDLLLIEAGTMLVVEILNNVFQ